MIEDPRDRLYELLPAVYRLRDEEVGAPLRHLLRIVGEQVDVVEEDIARLYANCFVDTCDPWAVSYIGDLVGYRPVYEPSESTAASKSSERFRVPRREVARTVHNRRRKGTLPLLELLADQVSGWPARAVEFYKLLAFTQSLEHPRPERGRTVNIRDNAALGRLGGPFDELSHTIDVRHIGSGHSRGRYNIPNVGLFVWRHRPYPVTEAPAGPPKGHFRALPHCYSFSVLGDTQLYCKPVPETEPTEIAGEVNLPIPIRRQTLEEHLDKLYGAWRSLYIREEESRRLILPEQIVPADLSDWSYTPPKNKVAVDPELGRIALNPYDKAPSKGLRVFYHYGFSADLGGGEYNRKVLWSAPFEVTVGENEECKTIGAALERWRARKPSSATIRIVDSREYVEKLDISLEKDQNLHLCASNWTRPVIRLPYSHVNRAAALRVRVPDHDGESKSGFALDGLLIRGQAVRVEGKLARLTIRHCTLVPGWALSSNRMPQYPAEPSLELRNNPGLRVGIENTILGPIQVVQDEVRSDPVRISLADSILDAPSRKAVYLSEDRDAYARLTVERSTVLGSVRVRALDLAENSIFQGEVWVAYREEGCMRFCSLAMAPEARTPRRYNCQPDLAERALRDTTGWKDSSNNAREAAELQKRQQVRPRFSSVRYSDPDYCQLSQSCADEIKRGADDESEMGVFHDLFGPLREANLHARLDEYTPADMEPAIFFET